jgi:hypothetical protein
MKKKIVVKDLVAENRKLQDTFKKRLNEGFFDNVLKKVGMGAPEQVKQKKVSTMTPKEKELYDKAKAAAGTAAEDAAWAEYEAERYGGGDKSPVLGKQDTPMAQELQKKTVEDLAKDMRLDFSKVKMKYDGTIDYDGRFEFNPAIHLDDKNNLLLPMNRVSILAFSPNTKGNPWELHKGMPKDANKIDFNYSDGEHKWFNDTGRDNLATMIRKNLNPSGKIEIPYKFDYEIKKPAGRSDDYDDYMQR